MIFYITPTVLLYVAATVVMLAWIFVFRELWGRK